VIKKSLCHAGFLHCRISTCIAATSGRASRIDVRRW
jgi:hypothetical protein